MTFLTIFTAPKPFSDAHITTIQRNALQSWLHLGEAVQVAIVGDEVGMAEVAAEFGLKHLPNVACNELGTPLVSSIFELARQASDSPLLAYVNADILLLPEFVESARQVAVQAEQFLLVGQRWDLDVSQPLDFGEGWPQRLRAEVQSRGKLHVPAGSDYFVFPRELFTQIPNFAIGRAGWDNWMIYHGVQQPWPVIDATASITIIHQNHDYGHLPQGQAHYDLDETFRNADMGGGMANMYMVLDTNRELRAGRIQRPRFRWARLLRRIERWMYPKDGVQQGPRWALTRRLRHLRRRFV
ncbi:MAG: hypothetical protein OEZ02_03635 [Anaerolineae bacterium]|nr:hypothetical protein [Anaerolineae bacterium]